MDLPISLLILTIIATSIVALFVYIRNKGNSIARAFVLLISSFVLWAIAQLFMYISPTAPEAVMAMRFANLFALLLAWSFCLFAYHFPNITIQLNRLFLFFLVISTMLSLYLSFDAYGITMDAYPLRSGYAFLLNKPAYAFYAVTFLGIFGYGYSLLVRKYLNSVGENRLLILHVIYSSLIPVIAGSILNMIMLFFDQFSQMIFGPSFTLIFTCVAAYIVFFRNRN